MTTALRRVEVERVEVRAQRPQRVAVAFDERATRGAPRQRLDAERAAAGEQVGDHGAVDQVEAAERVEHRFADLVGGGPGGRPVGCDEPATPELPATTRIAHGYAAH